MFLSKRNGIYYLWYVNEAGQKRKVTTHCRHKSDALKFLQSFKESAHTRLARKVPLQHFAKDLLAYIQANYSPKTLPIYQRALFHLCSIAGHASLDSINPLHFDRYKTERQRPTSPVTGGRRPISPVTVNIELRTLKAAMNFAVRWRLLEENPFEGLRLVSVPEESPTYFTKENFQRLIAVIEERWLRDVVAFAALTGMRRGEIVNLRWNDVDLTRREVHVHSSPTFKTKAGKSRTIPLNNVASELLRLRANASACEYVFTLNDAPILANWITHKLKWYTRELALSDKLNFHSLRHTFATWLLQEGVPIYEVQKLLGHSNISVTQVYSHLAASELHRAVEKISLSLN